MPIYEYRCPKCGRLASFLVRSITSHKPPACPHCGAAKMSRALSRFAAVSGRRRDAGSDTDAAAGPAGDMPGMGPAAGAPDLAGMEQMLSGVDENDPRSMGRVMRKMAEQAGEPIEGEMEEVVRRLEAGEDPEKIGDRMGDALDDDTAGGRGGGAGGGDTLYDG